MLPVDPRLPLTTRKVPASEALEPAAAPLPLRACTPAVLPVFPALPPAFPPIRAALLPKLCAEIDPPKRALDGGAARPPFTPCERGPPYAGRPYPCEFMLRVVAIGGPPRYAPRGAPPR